MTVKLVIVGSGAGGVMAAVEARKNDKDADIVMLTKEKHFTYSPCAMPFLIGGEIKQEDDIIVFNEKFFSSMNIKLVREVEVKSINTAKKLVEYEDKEKNKKKEGYDRLILATGSYAFIPPIEGLDKEKFFTLKNLDGCEGIISESNRILKERSGARALIVGGGLIGLEGAFALKKKGFNVLVVEASPKILPAMLDREMTEKVKEYIEGQGIRVMTGSLLKRVEKGRALIAANQGDINEDYDMLLIAAGTRPDTKLARDAGIKVDRGIVVDGRMRTSVEDVYACGDCAEFRGVLGEVTPMIGTFAFRSGKTAGANAAGGEASLDIALNTAITKLGGMMVASVGATGEAAEKAGINAVSSSFTSSSRSEYYPGGTPLTVRLVCTKEGLLLGAQIIGFEEVLGRINLMALAIQNRISIKDISNLENAYAPPLSPIDEPLSVAAGLCLKRLSLQLK